MPQKDILLTDREDGGKMSGLHVLSFFKELKHSLTPHNGHSRIHIDGKNMDFLSYETMCQLSLYLDPSDHFGNDWRMLADKMGLSMLEIRKLEREQEPTKVILAIYKSRSGKSVNDILRDLLQFCKEMGRLDVCTVVEHEIEKLNKHMAPKTMEHRNNESTHNDISNIDHSGYKPDIADIKVNIPPDDTTAKHPENNQNTGNNTNTLSYQFSCEDNASYVPECNIPYTINEVPNNTEQTSVMQPELNVPTVKRSQSPPSVPDLCKLLRAECRKCVKRFLLDNLPGRTRDLEKIINRKKYRDKLTTLKDNGIITEYQYNQLYPPPETGQMVVKELDIPILIILIRNLTKGIAINWDKSPGAHDLSPKDDMLRLKNCYPRITAQAAKVMDMEDFDKLLEEVAEPLKRLGANVENIYNHRHDHVVSGELVCDEEETEVRAVKTLGIVLQKYGRIAIVIGLTILLLVIGVIIYMVMNPDSYVPELTCDKKVTLLRNHTYMQFMTRDAWGAREPSGERDIMKHPTKYVIIAHAAGLECSMDTKTCCDKVKTIQNDHMDPKPKGRGWYDIGYNFIVAEDGVIYEGRGWDYVGAHSYKWNNKSIGIGFMGDFRNHLPHPRVLTGLKEFLKYGVHLGKLDPDYILYGQCQVRPFESPGILLYKELQTWPHWKRRIVTDEELAPHNRTSFCVDV